MISKKISTDTYYETIARRLAGIFPQATLNIKSSLSKYVFIRYQLGNNSAELSYSSEFGTVLCFSAEEGSEILPELETLVEQIESGEM